VTVDGSKVDIASYLVKPGEVVAISGPVREVAAAATELTGAVSGWLETDFEQLSGKVLRLPVRSDINAPVNEHLIVELYSRL
jgi:small subunit ribosomal protein S4